MPPNLWFLLDSEKCVLETIIRTKRSAAQLERVRSFITRGQAEMRRIGVACGARSETFSGLSGLGDLTVTCFSRLSRNRTFGERIGRGEQVATLLTESRSAIEGYPTARSARELATRLGIVAPITSEVFAMLYESKDPRRAVQDLLSRDSKAED